MYLFVILASKLEWTDVLIIASLVVGLIICIRYAKSYEQAKFDRAIRAPFSCPYCGSKMSYDDAAHGRYLCFDCQRIVIHGRDATEEENAEARIEEADCAAVRSYLRNEDVFKRIMDNARGHDLFTAKFWVAGKNRDRVTTTVYRRIADPDPASFKPSKFETIELDPVLLGFQMETRAGETVFNRALYQYIQSNYSYAYEVNFSPDSGVSIGIKI